jgi:Integrase core domain
VLTSFRQAADLHGYPASTLTDNGMVYTTRFAGGRGGRNHLEHELRRLDIVQKNSRPNHPTTCGKVERFQQTLKKWLRAQPHQPATIAELQTLLEEFQVAYNQHRPHKSLPHRATPATAYQARPKATPTRDRSTDSHDRVRHDTVSKTGSVTLRIDGRLRHIGIGRTYARTRVILLVQDLHVRVVNAATGELLRELYIDPRRDYQPQHTTQRQQLNLRTAGPAVRDVLRHHTGRADRI